MTKIAKLQSSLADWFSKPQVWGFFVSMAVMALVSVLFFVPNNFNGDTLQQQDMQQGAANGEEARAYEELTGEKALWTNSLFSGMPTFQISPTYPSNSLFTWLNSIYGLGLPAPSNLLFMMMFGMLIMCYCLRMRWWYALIAAVGWGLSSYFIIIIGAGHIWKFVTLTYVPPTIGALIMAYRGKYLSGAALMSLFAMLQLNANHPQITYYSAFVMGLLSLAFLVQDIREKRIRRWLAATGVCLLSGALALGANAPSLYNTYEYSKETKRSQSELTPLKSADAGAEAKPAERPTGGLPKEEIGGWSNTPSESFSLLIPNIKGGASIKPEKGSFSGLYISDTDEFKDNTVYGETDEFDISSQMSQYFGGKGMTNGPFYLGALLCALFLLGLLIVRGPVKWALLVATILSVCLAMGNHFEALTDFMIYNFPLYNKFRAAETALVIAALCVPLTGALALQKLFGKDGGWERYRIQVYISFGICILIALLGWVAPQIFGDPIRPEEMEALNGMRSQVAARYPDHIGAFEAAVDNIAAIRLNLVSADALRSLIVLLLGLGAVVLTTRRKLAAPAGALAVGMIVLVDLFTVDKRYVSAESFAATEFEFSDPLAADAVDKAISEDKGYYRVMDIPGFGNARRSFHHHMIGGYHAAKLNRYNDLIERRMSYVNRYGYMPQARVDSLIERYAMPEDREMLRNLAADYRVLDMLNARYIITGDSTVLQQNPYAAGPAWMARELSYVKNADAEMAALATIDPTAVAVADERFRAVLGDNVPSVVPGDTVVMTSYSPNTLTYDVTTRNGGVCVFSEVWFPWGWKATIDGKPADLGRVNYVLRALRVPAGSHKVSMTFDPDSIHNTTTAAYICVTLIYLLLLAALFRYYIGETTPREWLRARFKRK
ncbi:MAG: hypothetical protein ACI30N_00765 [Muribaculaceae bacterium]